MRSLAPAVLLLLAGCFHAAVETGATPSETQESFLNQLVGLLTLGIYTPMHIKVTCAAP